MAHKLATSIKNFRRQFQDGQSLALKLFDDFQGYSRSVLGINKI